MNKTWNFKQREFSWDTHVELVDSFLDDDDCLIDWMGNSDKFLLESFFSMTEGVLTTCHTKGKPVSMTSKIGICKNKSNNREMKSFKEVITPCRNQFEVRRQGESPHQCAFSSNCLLHLQNKLDTKSTRNYATISSVQEIDSFNHHHIH